MEGSSRALVEALCSDACAGRRAGTPGGALARKHIVEALRDAGLDPMEQPAPGCRGANVVATIPGSIDRWVLVGAHYDHLGVMGGEVFRGADDNAGSVGALVSVARSLAATRPDGRGVILVAFVGEEPPFYAPAAMGSQHYAQPPTAPLDRIDMMVALELLGHPIGPEGLPRDVRQSMFVLGAERSEGTSKRVDAIASSVDGVVARRVDAEVIPPLSDHLAFWRASVPFVLMTGARSATYHTPDDTLERLDWKRLGAVSRWLEAFVRDQCARPEGRVKFLREGRDDASTLDALRALLEPLRDRSPLAAQGLSQVRALRDRCDRAGRLPEALQPRAAELVGAIEQALA